MALLTEARAHLKGIITTEFAADGVTIVDDRLNPAVASDGNHYCGISPLGESEQSGQAGTWTGQLMIQMYMAFDPQIDPLQTVDPATIEAWASRLRVALKGDASVNTDTCWYIRLTEFVYPPDPTGNITRFHGSALIFGNNESMF